jgi:hypothetical protein
MKIDLTAAPPTREDLDGERKLIATLQRRWLLRLFPLVAAMVPVVWLTRDLFMGGGLAGLGFALALGTVAVFVMRFSFERELLASVKPLQCLQLETAMQDPVVERYLGELRIQGRPVTQREASEIRAYASETIKRGEAQREADAWQRVHGTRFEKVEV